MEEFMRIFFTGEALQRIFSFMCNNNNRDVQYKISNVISSMLKTTICIRLTPIGLAPFRNDITMILPYNMMDRTQLDYLENLTECANFTSPVGPVQGIGLGNGVVVITVLDSIRIWSNTVEKKNHPLPHKHLGGSSSSGIEKINEDARIAREEASKILDGRPVGGSCRWKLDSLDLLKAFVACVFRSLIFTDDDIRNGICEIVVQMVMNDVGLTYNTVDKLKLFVRGIRENNLHGKSKEMVRE